MRAIKIKVMQKLEKLKSLSEHSSDLQNTFIDFRGGFITSFDFDEEVVVVSTSITLSCGCCMDSEYEDINFKDLDGDELDTILNDYEITDLQK